MRYVKRWLALLCTLVVLCSAVGTLGVAAAPQGYERMWKVFPPAEFSDGLTMFPKAGGKFSATNTRCGTKLPADVEMEYLGLYIHVTLDAGMAAALNAGGDVELGNKLDASSGRVTWRTNYVTWHEGVNEVMFPFRNGSQKTLNLQNTIDWFRLTADEMEQDGTITFHEVLVVDITEGGILFGATDTHLQLSRPFDVTPNTVEVSVRVNAATELEAARYPIFSNIGLDANPIALSMDQNGALIARWGEQIMTVDCDLRTGVWVDVALVRDMAVGRFYVYIDGKQVASFSAADSADIVPEAAHCIASDGEGVTFIGGIADVRVWSDARTAEEIAARRVSKYGNRQNGIAPREQGLLGNWYLFGDADYVLDVQKDASAHKNHAVYRGSRADDWVDYDRTQYDFLYDENGNENYYSMVVIPDIQNLSTAANQQQWLTTAGWIADNVENENIVHVIGLGDASWGAGKAEYDRAIEGYDLFADKVSWNNVPGNHDYSWNEEYRLSANYSNAFSEEYLNSTASKGVYQGYFEDPYGRSTVENSYYCFGVNGVKWMILQLEFAPRQHVMAWANDLLDAHPDYNVILATHGYLNGDASYCNCYQVFTAMDKEEGGYMGNSTSVVWETVIENHDNVKMVLCGHNRNAEGSVAIRYDENAAGNVIPQIMINAQALDFGDTISPNYFQGQPMGMLGIFRFSADGTKAALEYYTPVHDGSYHVASNAIVVSMDVKADTACAHENTQDRTVAATCAKAGAERTVCAACGYVLAEESVPYTGEHAWDAGEVTIEPDMEMVGESIFTCTVCGDTHTEEVAALVRGNANGDDVVDSTDARLTLQYAVGKIRANTMDVYVTDVNSDGKVDSTDARLILQYAVGKIQQFK